MICGMFWINILQMNSYFARDESLDPIDFHCMEKQKTFEKGDVRVCKWWQLLFIYLFI